MTMPSSSSKIPLPKSSLTSPSSRTDPEESPSHSSRIPVIKYKKTSGNYSDLSGLSSPASVGKENISLDASLQPKIYKSRIPYNQAKLSPTKDPDPTNLNINLPGGVSGQGTESRAAPYGGEATRVTPTSRIPTRGHRRKSSVESFSAEELDWESRDASGVSRLDSDHAYSENSESLPRSRDGNRAKGRKASPSSSSSSSSATPGHELSPAWRESDPPHPGTNPSPNKTRRLTSPSKIPISSEYMRHSTSNSSLGDENYTTPHKTPTTPHKTPTTPHKTPPRLSPGRGDWDGSRRGSRESEERQVRTSQSIQSEMFQTAQESEDSEEQRRSPRRSKRSCSRGREEEVGEMEEERSPGDGIESTSKRGNSEALPREGLHLDVGSKIPLPKTKIPTTPKSAPSRHVPEHSWSLSRDEHSPRHNTYTGSSPQSRSTDSSLTQSNNSHFLNQSAGDSFLNQSCDSPYKTFDQSCDSPYKTLDGDDSSYKPGDSGESPYKVFARNDSMESGDMPYKVLESGDSPYKVPESGDSSYIVPKSGDSHYKVPEIGDSPFKVPESSDSASGDSPFLRNPSSSRLPFVPLQDKSSSSGSTSTDSDGSIQEKEGRKGRKKNYEAFVMTGDRMINLAKTPAHMDFQSKYYRPVNSSNQLSLEPAKPSSSSLPASPVEPEAVNVREQPTARRSLVRNSKSEDQLALDHSDQFLHLDEDDKLGSSCHTLLDNSESVLDTSEEVAPATPARPSLSRPPHVSSESSSSRSGSKGSSTDQLISSQPSDEACSPDFSTSSLISCSEHYNGESLLDNMSPQSPSSPDTPEWSLIANGESFHKDVSSSHNRKASRKEKKDSKGSAQNGSEASRSNNNDSMITNRDNRVIITIGNTNGHDHQVNGLSSPGTSSGTITPDLGYSELQEEAPSLPATSPPPLHPPSPNISSEEESDMDSLHSYHPPVKVVDIPSAVRLGKRLYNLEGFRKSDVSRHLSKNNDFSRAVAEEYCKLFSFSDLTLDAALRVFLARFCLTGETQERERVLLHFSKRFLECNPNKKGPSAFQSHDSVHTLTCAIMLLNTDLHSESLQRRMTPEEFVENLAELNDGQNFPEDLLKNIYFSIKCEPIEWVLDEEEEAENLPQQQRPTPSTSPETNPAPPSPDVSSSVNLSGSQAGGFNPFLTLPDPNTAVDYKRGYVMRKCCFDAHGKKTKLGKRGWKMFYLTLRDMVLYCFKDEKSMRTPGAFENNANAIRVHHAVAISAMDYTKKQFVFRLRTSDQAEFLFQTSDDKELMTWVETINTVVARYSSPPLPAPCSNSSKFQRPLLPSSRSNLSLGDQISGHRRQVAELSQELSDHTSSPPPRGAKSGLVVQYREKAEFLSAEVARYSVYAAALEAAAHKQENNQMASSPLKAITS